MKLIYPSIEIFDQLKVILRQIPNEDYQFGLSVFSGASVGQHVRHIVEFYQCLLTQEGKTICYDSRKRDHALESDPLLAINTLEKIQSILEAIDEDKTIHVKAQLSGEESIIPSSFSRELLYVIEHAVHHMAIIKIGLLVNFPNIKLPENFGVADSTIRFKEKCAQ